MSGTDEAAGTGQDMEYETDIFIAALESLEQPADDDPVSRIEWLRLRPTLFAWLYRPC